MYLCWFYACKATHWPLILTVLVGETLGPWNNLMIIVVIYPHPHCHFFLHQGFFFILLVFGYSHSVPFNQNWQPQYFTCTLILFYRVYMKKLWIVKSFQNHSCFYTRTLKISNWIAIEENFTSTIIYFYCNKTINLIYCDCSIRIVCACK